MNDLGLIINIKKSKIMRFSKSNRNLPAEQKLGADIFEYCEVYKYLGFHITYNLNDNIDIEKRLKDFYSKFYSIKSNFSNLNEEIFIFLFKSFCTPNYGLNLWNLNKFQNSKEFKAFKIAYSNAVKSIFGLSKFDSTHFIFNACNLLILDHHVNYVQCSYFLKLFKEPRGLIYLLPGIKHGYLFASISKIFKTTYKVSILDNDLDALKSRITYTQNQLNL